MSSLEDQMMENLSKEIAEEIDWEILADIFKACGWVTITFNPRMSDVRAHLVKEWLKKNCKGHYRSRKDIFMFEHESDAVNFSLRWS
jgi:hypothetical protein